METLHQGASAALMLAGLAALLLGIAALVWAVGRMRVDQGQLALRQARSERANAREQAQADTDRQRMELVQAVLPVATTALGHWLGSRRKCQSPDDLPPPRTSPCIPPCGGHASPSMRSPFSEFDPIGNDETHLELDLGSLFDSLADAGFVDWLRTVLDQSRTPPAAPTTTPEPGPDAASASTT